MAYSRVEVLRKFKICLIIGVILAVFMGAVNIILPIPIISMCIECFKAVWHGKRKYIFVKG